jgi:hypothetical protein
MLPELTLPKMDQLGRGPDTNLPFFQQLRAWQATEFAPEFETVDSSMDKVRVKQLHVSA